VFYIARSPASRRSRGSKSAACEPPAAQPGRERLRHLVIGSPEGVRGAINHLHLLRYAEQREWSRLVTIPESGILITPEQGEVFSYLLRYRQLG
jgi:hypothetical protein